MKTKHIIGMILIILMINIPLHSQNVATLYFMEEITERNNMNPAFTPNCKFYFDFVALPNFHFNIGNNSLILNDILYNNKGITHHLLSNDASKTKFLNHLRPTTNIDANFRLNILSFGFRVKKQHFITFDMGIQADIAGYVPKDIFKFALYGTPDENGINTFNFNTLGVDASVYSNLSVGYMNVINDKLTVGGKLKFLMGYANINTNINKLELNASRNNWTLETQARINASLPISYNKTPEGNIDYNSIEIQPTDQLLSLLYKPAGYGAAIDLGATYKPIKNLTVSAAITDLGFINWNRNLVTGNMEGSHMIDGLIDYNVVDSINPDEILDNLKGLGNEIIETIKTDDGTPYNTMINATFAVGAEYGILNNKISFGALNRLMFNNQHIHDEVTISANFRPADWFKTTISYSFIDGRWGNIGLGLNLRAGMFNMFLIADYLPLSWANIVSAERNINIPVPNRTQRVNLQAGLSWNLRRFSNDRDNDGVFKRYDKCPNTDIDFLMAQCPDLKKKELVNKQGCDLDDDKDGIHNCIDRCPNTPEGVVVDSIGCPVDSDKDGVADYLDQCPETPSGVAVDNNGCPIDSDGDGVADYIDQCPETPNNIIVDSIGCPVDSDKDGVADYLDRCPETPTGVIVDAVGCPVDSDKDGVADYIDECDNTPLGVVVDSVGCPIDTDGDGIVDYLDKCPSKAGPESNQGCPILEKKVRNLLTKAMNGIQFESGKDIIKKSSYPILNQIVAVLELNSDYKLSISGHTDNVGNDDLNMKLSIERAAAVKQYFVEKGIDSKRLSSQGFGETKPIADNKTYKGRALNRRVEFEVSYEEITIEKIENVEMNK